ncbi:helix-turn-helix domain-containing protein [Bailinhaonella thermotolerans]|uniref:AraC family transcriptional regulator n=1 Tax=Bailinhaonella thermotolerans TaxID=1070861 RepID=A0A3A4B4W5_9ACTN|nr:helix-turn-helix domain-containing protein [Bailinhaonella thermotolerans]RJL36191.1 AraC family transcriptional regulator [Bailinhaonella thermotolerans]
MRTFVHGAAVWEVASPRGPSRVAGVAMAGFRVRDMDTLRMVPHPAVTLLLEFGPGSPEVDCAAGRRRGGIVAGPGFGSGGTVRARGENVECVQVRLSPVIARSVLGVSPADLGGEAVALDDLWGGQAALIGERLAAASSWEERFALVDALLARRHEGPAADPEVAWAWRRIGGARGLVRVDRLAAEVGWSRKRLWSRFHAQIGLPPKRAARLVRFDHAAHRLVAGESAALVAAAAGYADQSHLHRDVAAFTGLTPSAVPGEPFLAVDPIAWPAGTPAAPYAQDR